MARKRVNPLPSSASSNLPIGKRLASLRKSRGLTQAQLADLLGVTQQVISDYEVGRASIASDIIPRFCSTLRCSADTLLGIAADIPDRKENLRLARRFKSIEKLPVNQQKALLQTIDGFLKGANRA